MEHKTPSEAIFNEIKKVAKQIWTQNYSDEYGYVTEKTNRIDSITNLADNVMTCYRMFDHSNQLKMMSMLSVEAKDYIDDNN